MPIKSPGWGRGVKAHPAVAFASCTIGVLTIIIIITFTRERPEGFDMIIIIIITFTRESPEGCRHASLIPRRGGRALTGMTEPCGALPRKCLFIYLVR
jgi:hypothetical protein